MQFFRVLVFLPCFIYAGVCLSAGNADNQILSAEHADNEVKNRLVGQCWKYKYFANAITLYEMDICFHQDDIHMIISDFYMGVGMGRDMGWQNWYTNGNKFICWGGMIKIWTKITAI
ncbi:hypothetical protein N5853_01200 [Bartonella sp. HY329]|uniref:hypothetical protein n=1 Tax=unclassified Bartonella TaxID=2645622 RepID=UPI0021C61D9C|nr:MULTISPECIES: hypothetical protein [unclassified Bartonella]UXM95303.1 hypothetical protein N5853_01200 [Bartonella sp. HY329]UXN09628.1 hypothetical protein N5852_01205 [Bartonella sp. HY328]